MSHRTILGDVRAATQHIIVARRWLEEAGRVDLGLEPAHPIFSLTLNRGRHNPAAARDVLTLSEGAPNSSAHCLVDVALGLPRRHPLVSRCYPPEILFVR